MNGRQMGLLCAATLCFLSGCQREKPVDTRIQDERAIREADAATLKSAQSKDVDGVIANYADDASWLAPNAPVVSDKAAIRAGWSKLITSPGFNIDWQIKKLEVARSGDLAYSIYAYQMTYQGPDAMPARDHGKDMIVWKKEADGAWKIGAEAFNSDVPFVTQAAPSTSNVESRHRAVKRRAVRKRRRTR